VQSNYQLLVFGEGQSLEIHGRRSTVQEQVPDENKTANK
jgi:hypothetical protein